MEQSTLSRSKKNEARVLLKKCFKNPMFSLVPFEIWRDLIVFNADAKAITVLAQTCHAFKGIALEISLFLALMFRKQERIDLAKKFILKSAKSENSLAMFYIGYACHYVGGWGFQESLREVLLAK